MFGPENMMHKHVKTYVITTSRSHRNIVKGVIIRGWVFNPGKDSKYDITLPS